MNKRKSVRMVTDGVASGVFAASDNGSEDAAIHPTMDKPTIVMVHGAWHWGGCFLKVVNLLAQMGYPVVSPDLKSHGYSAATYDQVTDMADYVAPVSAILQAATSPVVLLGHSMGGVALTYLAELYPDKIRKLIYLTAFMTPRGKSANSYIFSTAYATDPVAVELFQLLSASSDNKGVVLDAAQSRLVKAAFYADCSDRDVAIAAANVIPINSNIPYTAVAASTAARFGSIPRMFIECTLDKAIPIAQQRQMQADVPGATVITLATGHSPFFSEPDQLAHLIATAAS
ncbi:alpha/beta fold hydrolase [Variovorax paradoxus]|nr:alpha/beta fold hydrolase [Variovorax paradoxus]